MFTIRHHGKGFRYFTLLKLIYITISIVAADISKISKSEWNGRESRVELHSLELPVHRIIITHTAGADCNNQETCSQQMRNIQNFQMDSMHFDDIAYNFLIGNDGNVYEGRGWDKQGAFAKGYNSGSLGIAFIGNYEKTQPTEMALEAAKSLLEFGVQSNYIGNDYKLFGHRQITATNSPGSALYDIIKTWPHWSRSI